jgi:hypothetical protein
MTTTLWSPSVIMEIEPARKVFSNAFSSGFFMASALRANVAPNRIDCFTVFDIWSAYFSVRQVRVGLAEKLANSVG